MKGTWGILFACALMSQCFAIVIYTSDGEHGNRPCLLFYFTDMTFVKFLDNNTETELLSLPITDNNLTNILGDCSEGDTFVQFRMPLTAELVDINVKFTESGSYSSDDDGAVLMWFVSRVTATGTPSGHVFFDAEYDEDTTPVYSYYGYGYSCGETLSFGAGQMEGDYELRIAGLLTQPFYVESTVVSGYDETGDLDTCSEAAAEEMLLSEHTAGILAGVFGGIIAFVFLAFIVHRMRRPPQGYDRLDSDGHFRHQVPES